MAFFSVFASCVYGYQPCFWALPTITLGESAAAASIGLINAIGNLGGFFGPFMLGYLVTRTGSFNSGLVWLLVDLAVAGILVLVLGVWRLPHKKNGSNRMARQEFTSADGQTDKSFADRLAQPLPSLVVERREIRRATIFGHLMDIFPAGNRATDRIEH